MEISKKILDSKNTNVSASPFSGAITKEARKEGVKMILFKLQYPKDKEQAEQISRLRDGKKIN